MPFRMPQVARSRCDTEFFPHRNCRHRDTRRDPQLAAFFDAVARYGVERLGVHRRFKVEFANFCSRAIRSIRCPVQRRFPARVWLLLDSSERLAAAIIWRMSEQPMTQAQASELLNELRRLNEILYAQVQLQVTNMTVRNIPIPKEIRLPKSR